MQLGIGQLLSNGPAFEEQDYCHPPCFSGINTSWQHRNERQSTEGKHSEFVILQESSAYSSRAISKASPFSSWSFVWYHFILQHLLAHECRFLCSVQTTEAHQTHGNTSGKRRKVAYSSAFAALYGVPPKQRCTNQNQLHLMMTKGSQKLGCSRSERPSQKTSTTDCRLDGSGGLNKTPLVSILRALEGKAYAAELMEPLIPIAGSLQSIQVTAEEEKLHC